MGGGVIEQLDLIPRASNHIAVSHHHGTHGNFIGLTGLHSLTDGVSHEILIALQIDDGFVTHGMGLDCSKVHLSGAPFVQ